MIKDLIKVANRLDLLGLKKEADYLDSIIQKVAAYTDFGGGFDDGQIEGSGPTSFDIKLKELKEKAKETASEIDYSRHSGGEDIGEQIGIYMNGLYQKAKELGFDEDFADLLYEDEVKKMMSRRSRRY